MNEVTSSNGLSASETPGMLPQVALEHRVCRTWALPAGPDRQQVAQRLVAEVVDVWRLPVVRSQRWLVTAADVLAGPGELELCVQLDRISQLVSVELWSDSHVVFGIDDWIGI